MNLLDIDAWKATIDHLARRHRGDAALIARCQTMLGDGTVARQIALLERGDYEFEPVLRHRINRDAQGGGKVVHTAAPRDDLLLRTINRIVAPAAEPMLGNVCHSFRRGRGARTAMARLTASADAASTVHLDITNFFNSVDPVAALRHLDGVTMDPLVRTLIEKFLLTTGGTGLMVGTPLAPLLSNLYMRDVDHAIGELPVRAVRYSDDFLLLGEAADVAAAETVVRAAIAERGLCVNESKTRRTSPGERWQFLGMSYDGKNIGLADHTGTKFRARVRRRARLQQRRDSDRTTTPESVCRDMARHLNRKLFGISERGHQDFSWSAWFFPVLTTDADLAVLDEFTQEQIRVAASGIRGRRNRDRVPYSMLRDCGYIPLVSAYHAQRRGDAAHIRNRAERVA